MASPLLEIKDLEVHFHQSGSISPAVKSASFELHAGETLGLVGESGSGKSISALSILQLLPENARHKGEIVFEGKNLLTASEKEIRAVRGNQIGMIFQEPMTALNPLHTIEKQICEVLSLHLGLRPQQASQRALELLELVGIQEAAKKLPAYPHELSGGQRQRAMIAMALACEPKILIADEPTTALDVTVQRQILSLLKELQQKFGMAILFISHDLNLIQHVSHRICVMKDGEMVETGSTKDVFNHPKHPYTIELLNAEPSGAPEPVPSAQNKIIEGSDIRVWFPVKAGFFRKTVDHIKAVTDVSISVSEGQTLGVVGESGSGKTTLGMALLKLQDSEGKIYFEGNPLHSLNQKQCRPYRRQLQVVFQDPYGSLSPRMTIADIIGEGLDIHQLASNNERDVLIIKAMDEVGLDPQWRHRYPHEFSGGQRQRIAIARALVLKPKLIILDEPTSALDRTVQSQVIELLRSLQKKYNLSYIFISHDLAVVKAMSHRILVMKDGEIVEQGSTDQIFHHPQTGYTRELLEAAFE
ncbi:ABC transporter ATP-binding protein [Endozoicomonas numazuensis]|uniref:Microcin ABC transporter ATP-binding protein n=1 Tax=Endozoicomonas numazuensis TaxID=1137799 RepID=A0A081N9D9_9GAMM|nr:ABC transporter ATP-binding protein [Endozoicomonas numazuensis]KEQ15062.1 microcin ABC transporter ATP-binding protein [Endozoicomonas numazuensis]